MTRTILVLAVIGAFVLGSIATGTIAYADKDDKKKGNPLRQIVSLLEQILTAIEGQEVNVVVDEVTVANPDPIPVEVTNIPEINDEVLVVNTDPIEVTGSLSADPVCPKENVEHWMNFKVSINNALIHSSEPTIVPTIILLPVSFSGAELIQNDNKDVVISDRLNEMGYTQTDGDPVDIFDIGSVDMLPDHTGYSTICAEN